MAVRYEPSILYKNFDITPIIRIFDDGTESAAQYIITDVEGNDIGDPVDSLGDACRLIDSLNEMLELDDISETTFAIANKRSA
ncbi:MAG: hypothetical protein D6B28_10720 [Gammaproteobacteria bacterium]|nr:MAG: hypothetical protein D6B28_10720 [Gammaproteobacteria bacterium]